MSIDSKYEFPSVDSHWNVSKRAFGNPCWKHQSYLYTEIVDLINRRRPEIEPENWSGLHMGHDEKVEVVLDVFLSAVHYLNKLEAHREGFTEKQEDPNIICRETKLSLCFEIERVLRHDVLPLIQKIIKENT